MTTMTTQRMHLTSDGFRTTIRYTDALTGERVQRKFRAPVGEVGYVRELIAGRSDCPQVCERLAGMGVTLMASAESLPRVIRREYRRMVAAERAAGLR